MADGEDPDDGTGGHNERAADGPDGGKHVDGTADTAAADPGTAATGATAAPDAVVGPAWRPDGAGPVGGTGLKGLTERLAAAGGTLRSGPDGRRGFRVTAELPVGTGDGTDTEELTR
ncbi:hypothetical protein PQR15_25680 [Streptomyces lydicus]|nr:hypothetical protein [Streptomyces lydicus]